MKGVIMYCPLLNARCREKECAWWHGKQCAIKYIARYSIYLMDLEPIAAQNPDYDVQLDLLKEE